VDRQLIGGEDKLLWLLRGDLKGETGSEIKATQYQALQTKYHSTKYYKRKPRTNAEYKQFDETVERVIRACRIFVKSNTCREMIQFVLNCTITSGRK